MRRENKRSLVIGRVREAGLLAREVLIHRVVEMVAIIEEEVGEF